jgi:acyl carrier protein
MTTFEKIREIIATTLNVAPEIITESLSIGDIEQWDSMGNMAIIAAIEAQMGIEFPIDDLFELNSVKALIDEIEKIS